MILSPFDRSCSQASAGHLLTAVDYAIASAINDGAFSGIRQTTSAALCGKCDGTGYKDHAGFAMDLCDHG